DRIFAAPDAFEVGGRRFGAPNRVHRALHAAYHATVGSFVPPLRTVRDIAGYIVRPELGPAVLAAEAREWRGEPVLAEAVRSAFASLSFEEPEWRTWLEAVRVDEREQAIVTLGQRTSVAPVGWSTVRELSWSARGQFLWAVAAPSSALLHARGLSRLGRIVHGTRRVVASRWSLPGSSR
ncbi:MAG TPA: hypothetical protein VGM93_07840, partial [Acidimicrobiales bacterium]